MRSHIKQLAALALCLSSTPVMAQTADAPVATPTPKSTVAASAPGAPITINGLKDFAIVKQPAGCEGHRFYSTTGDGGLITCDTEEHFKADFTIASKLHVKPETKGGKFLYTVTE
ncbi:MAG: hypothetical protein JWL75_376 [Parcubacteria group bacterium]|nr:hypothetical protein [Parcubacteria group bacterium]